MTNEIDVQGLYDRRSDGAIRYLGKARRQRDGTWRCLADVGGALCLVEVTVSPDPWQELHDDGGLR